MFVPFIHYYSGKRIFIDTNSISCVREEDEEKTLVVTQANKGQYVSGSADDVLEKIENAKKIC